MSRKSSQRKQQKNRQRYRFLQDLELKAGIRAEADAIGGHRQALLQQLPWSRTTAVPSCESLRVTFVPGFSAEMACVFNSPHSARQRRRGVSMVRSRLQRVTRRTVLGGLAILPVVA